MRRLTDRYGAPFDVIIVSGTATEDGKSLRSGQELAPVLAQAVEAYTSAGIGIEAGGMMNNLFTLVRSETDDGELRMLGSLGYLRAEFDGPAVVRSYLAPTLAWPLLKKWASEVDEPGAQAAELEAADTTHMRSEYELLAHAQVNDNGELLFMSFDDFAAQRFQGRKIGAKEFPSELLEAEAAYRGELNERLGDAERRLCADLDAYAGSVIQRARQQLNGSGPTAGATVLRHGLRRLEDISNAVSVQRDELAPEIELMEAAVAEGFIGLDAAAARAGLLRSVKREVAALLGMLNQSFALRRPFELAERVIAVAGDAKTLLSQAVSSFDALVTNMNAVAADLQITAATFESAEPSPLDEVIRRPLHDADDLHALHELAASTVPGAVSEQLEREIRLRIGVLDPLLDQDGDAVRELALAAAERTFAMVAAMSADGFLGWRCEQRQHDRAVFLRKLIDRAPLLCRYDRTRLPDDDDAYESSFVLIGVPDEAVSTFFGTDQGVLVTTADPRHISILRLTFGMTPTALWGWKRMRRARAALTRRGDDGRSIYPDLRDRPRRARPRGTQRRAGRRAK